MARGRVEGKVSKRKMVEMAMDELGNAKPAEMREHILKTHGVDISAQMISSYRSNLKKIGGGTSSGSGRVGLAGVDAQIGLRDLKVLRDLLARVGPAQLQLLIKLLGK